MQHFLCCAAVDGRVTAVIIRDHSTNHTCLPGTCAGIYTHASMHTHAYMHACPHTYTQVPAVTLLLLPCGLTLTCSLSQGWQSYCGAGQLLLAPISHIHRRKWDPAGNSLENTETLRDKVPSPLEMTSNLCPDPPCLLVPLLFIYDTPQHCPRPQY